MVAVRTMQEKMRVLSQSELLSLSRIELMGLLRRIASELTALPEGSHELRIAHYNLRNIRAAQRGQTFGRAECVIRRRTPPADGLDCSLRLAQIRRRRTVRRR